MSNDSLAEIYERDEQLLKKMGVMTSTDLENAMKGVRGFKGVYAMDQIPMRLSPGESFIANIDRASRRGSHWIAVYRTPLLIYYYNSFARSPTLAVRQLARNEGVQCVYNRTRHQQRDELNCGERCMDVIHALRANRQAFHNDGTTRLRV